MKTCCKFQVLLTVCLALSATITQADDWRMIAAYPAGTTIETYDSFGSHTSAFAAVQGTGIAYHHGIFYIADYWAWRVYEYDVYGNYLGEIIASEPWDVVFDSAGYMYVTEVINNRVLKFNPDGSYNSVFVSGLSSPRGICIDSSGKFYVACYGSGNVRRFNSSGTEITPALQAASNPMCVTWGPDGYLYVGALSNNTVRKVNVSNDTATVVVSVAAYDLQMGPDGNLYIADVNGYRALRYNILKQTWSVFSTPQGPSQCYAVGFYPVTGKSKLLAGYTNATKIERYDGETGSRIDTFLQVQSSNVVYHNGIVYVVNYGANRIYKYSVTGTLLGEIVITGPCNMAFDGAGYAYVTQGSGTVAKLNPDGSFNSNFVTGLNTPRGICVAPGGTVYVACYGSSNVRRFDSEGFEITPSLVSGSVPYSVEWGPDAYLYVGATSDNTLRKVNVGTGGSTTVASVSAWDLKVGPDENLYVANLYNYRVDKYNITSGTLTAFSTPQGPNQCNTLAFYPANGAAINFVGAVRGDNNPVLYKGGTATVDIVISNPCPGAQVMSVTYQLINYKEQVVWTMSKQITLSGGGYVFDTVSVTPSTSGIFKLQAAYTTDIGTAGTEDVVAFGVSPNTSSSGENVDDPASPFGVHTRLPSSYPHLGVAKKAGIKWGRIMDYDISTWWSTVEQSNNQWTWYDEGINNARANYMTILGMLFSTPRWASSEPTGSQDYYTYRSWPATNINDFKDYVTNVVNHYKISNKIKTWEVWNEADFPMFWMGTAQQYADYVAAAYQSAKAADPSCTVIAGGGLPKVTQTWLQSVFAAGALNNMDKLAFHGYPDPYIPPVGQSAFANATYIDRIDYLRDLMRQYSVVRPIWDTETAVWGCTFYNKIPLPGLPDPSTWRRESQSWAGSELVKMNTINHARGAEKVFYYYMDYVSDPTTANYHQSLWEYDGAPTSKLMAHTAMVYVLSGARFVAAARLGTNVYGYVYQKSNGGSVAVLWSEVSGGSTITINSNVSLFTKRDLMGNSVTLPNLTLQLTTEPFYLISDSINAGYLLTLLNHEEVSDIIVVRNDNWVFRLSGANLSILASGTYNQANSIATQSDADVVAGRNDGYIQINRGSDFGLLAAVQTTSAVTAVAVQPTTSNVLAARNDGVVFLKNGTDLGPIAQYSASLPVTQLGVKYDGETVITRNDGWTFLVKAADLLEIARYYPSLPVTAQVIRPNGDILLARNDGYVFLLSGWNLNQIAAYYPSGLVAHMAAQGDGDVVVVRNDGYVFLLRSYDLAQIASYNPSGTVNALGIQPDGDVIIARNDGTILLLNGSNLAPITSVSGYGTVSKMGVQTDGDVVISNSAGNAYILSGANLSQLAVYNGLGVMTHLAMQPSVP